MGEVERKNGNWQAESVISISDKWLDKWERNCLSLSFDFRSLCGWYVFTIKRGSISITSIPWFCWLSWTSWMQNYQYWTETTRYTSLDTLHGYSTSSYEIRITQTSDHSECINCRLDLSQGCFIFNLPWFDSLRLGSPRCCLFSSCCCCYAGIHSFFVIYQS